MGWVLGTAEGMQTWWGLCRWSGKEQVFRAMDEVRQIVICHITVKGFTLCPTITIVIVSE